MPSGFQHANNHKYINKYCSSYCFTNLNSDATISRKFLLTPTVQARSLGQTTDALSNSAMPLPEQIELFINLLNILNCEISLMFSKVAG